MKPLRAIGFFIFGFASATAVSALLTLLPRFFLTLGYTAATQKMYMGRDLIFMLGTILFLAPVVEEIIFRGHMLNTLLEHLPEKTAVLVSSIIFALLHGSIIWILYAFLLGQILAKTSMKEDNIAYGVLLHIGFNATSVVNYFITDDPVKYEMFFGSKALIAVYGILGLTISLFLAAVYTGRLDLKLLWRRVTGK
jgi:membrane protease YdiL (CAAX protease family)